MLFFILLLFLLGAYHIGFYKSALRLRASESYGLVLALAVVMWLALPSAVTLREDYRPAPRGATECQLPREVVQVALSRDRYPNIYDHVRRAEKRGWPAVLVLDHSGEAARRAQLLKDVPIRAGYDRDEYPPAGGREGWLADVSYVPSSENRSEGAVVGNRLRAYCDGTRFTFVWS